MQLCRNSQVYGLMERGAEQRATGATKLNEMSSRSHAVLQPRSTIMALNSRRNSSLHVHLLIASSTRRQLPLWCTQVSVSMK
jgi:Kinesin motor domain